MKIVPGLSALAHLAGFPARAAEKVTVEHNEPVLDGTWELLLVPWYRLLDRDFKSALALADRAITIDPSAILYATNKAHALMFLGRAGEARSLYLRHKGRRIGEDAPLWEEAILDDFKEFEMSGLRHIQIGEIKVLLRKVRVSSESAG
jgi:hypothetical protein